MDEFFWKNYWPLYPKKDSKGFKKELKKFKLFQPPLLVDRLGCTAMAENEVDVLKGDDDWAKANCVPKIDPG